MTVVIVALATLGAFSLWFWKRGFALIAEKKGTKELEELLFHEGNLDKESILETMTTITNGKYNTHLLLDYFLKIKGLQVVNMYDQVNFWTRKYLMSPTILKLNYFEQVKFYETFLNYPVKSNDLINTATDNNTYITSESNNVFIKRQLA